MAKIRHANIIAAVLENSIVECHVFHGGEAGTAEARAKYEALIEKYERNRMRDVTVTWVHASE